MSADFRNLRQRVAGKISRHIDRFGVAASSMILLIEAIWAASVLLPVLLVIGVLYEFTNAWMAILPGMLGAVTFLILLTIGGFAAALPSSYLSRWRDWAVARIEARYPEAESRNGAPHLPHGLEIQDAD